MADEPTTTDPAATADPSAKPDPATDPLRAPGLAALQQERDARKALEEQIRELKPLAARAAKAEAERDTALAEANRRIIAAEVKAAAAGRLADPGDALRLLDLAEFTVADDGTVDTSAVAKAIDGLVKAKPYLAAGEPKRFAGPGDGGTGAGKGAPSQLTRADLARMDPDAIVRAKEQGRLDDLLGIKS